MVHTMIGNDLPVYEDHLREIIYQESKEKIGEVITDMEYKKRLKEM